MSPPVGTLAPGSTRRRLGSGSGSLGSSKGRLVLPAPGGKERNLRRLEEQPRKSLEIHVKIMNLHFFKLPALSFRMSLRENHMIYKSRILR